MKNKLLKLGLTAILVASVVACGPGKKRSEKVENFSGTKFSVDYKSDKEAIKGGTLNVALVGDQAFKGIFSPILYTDSDDWKILENMTPPIFWTGDDFKAVNGGLADFDYDVDNNVIKVTIRKDLKWSDGVPIKIDDLIMAYQIIGHPDYTGVRYSDDLKNVVGMEEYHTKKANNIKGLERVDDYTLKVHLKSPNPNVYAGTGGLVGYFVPKHVFEKLEVAKLQESDEVRIKPLSYGPWKLKQVIPGESVELVPNEYWYDNNSRPTVDKKIIKVLPTSSLVSSMKVGEYDIYLSAGSSTYKEYKDFDNLAILGYPGVNFSFFGYNMGHYDKELKKNITDKDKVMTDIELRKAMSYAVNIQEVVEKFYNNLKLRASSIIPPAFNRYHSSEFIYNYDVEKAKEILDKAGYKDVDGDGIRENKDGKPLVIRLAMGGGSDIAESLSQKFIQDWKAVGLNVTLATGRLLGNNFWDIVESNEGYEVFIAGFSVGTSLDIRGLFSEDALFNMARAVDKKNDELLAQISSVESLKDENYKINKIKEWNDYYMKNVLGFFPIWYSYDILPINKRVKEYTLSPLSVDANNIKEGITQIQKLPASN